MEQVSASYFSLDTGLFTGRQYRGPADHVELNTPPGCGYVEGLHDPKSRRVDLSAFAARQPAIDAATARIECARAALFAPLAMPGTREPEAETAQPAAVDAARDELDAATAALAEAQALPVVVDYQPPSPPDTDLVTHTWDADAKRWVATPTAAALAAAEAAAAEAAVQARLDAVARSWGYDSLLSAASYAASAVPQFKAEAAVLIAWRDATWAAAYALQAAVKTGAVQTPASIDELLALLPPPPARPDAAEQQQPPKASP